MTSSTRRLTAAFAAFAAFGSGCHGSDAVAPQVGPPSKVTITASPASSAVVGQSAGTMSVVVADAAGVVGEERVALLAFGQADDVDRTGGTVLAWNVAATSSNGVTGAPSRAAAEAGNDLLAEMTDELVRLGRQAARERAPVDEE